jgi:shikimate dehydrogenase
LIPVNPEELEDFLLHDKIVSDVDGQSISVEELSGFNITIPHKVKTREILEKEFPSKEDDSKIQDIFYYVKLSGAINTVKREGGKLKYWNTDASGFLKSLENDLNFRPKNKKILLIGCGGAGRAIIASLSWINVGIKKIYVNDINVEAMHSAEEYFQRLPQPTYLKDKLEFVSTENIPELIKTCDLLVNASPVGMQGEDNSVIDSALLHEGLYVYDIVYNKVGGTRLIREAKSRGLTVGSGLDMLLRQGMDAFGLWTGEPAPEMVMRQALNEGVSDL